MGKKTTKQIKATLTNDIARRFSAKIDDLEERLKNLSVRYEEKCKECRDYRAKCKELEDRLEKIKTQNEEYVTLLNMSDEDVAKVLESFELNKRTSKTLDKIMSIYNTICN